MMSDNLHDVFLSYSRKDVEMMRRIRASLLSAGLRVWTDEGIKAGTDLWINSIETAIEQSTALLVLLSPNAKASVWVKKELRYANVQGKKIFSLMIDGDSKSSIPFEVIGSQFVDIRTKFGMLTEKLIPDMCNYLGDKGVNQLQIDLAHERRLNKDLQTKIDLYERNALVADEANSLQAQAEALGQQAFQKLNSEDYFGALEDYTVALFLNSKEEYASSFTFYRARALRFLGNLELAQQEFLSLDHGFATFNQWVWWELAEITEELGNYEEAISIYRMLSHSGTDYEAYKRFMYLEQKLAKESRIKDSAS